jgi:hypothetical protein
MKENVDENSGKVNTHNNTNCLLKTWQPSMII